MAAPARSKARAAASPVAPEVSTSSTRTMRLPAMAGRFAEREEFRLVTRGDQLPVFAVTTAPDVSSFDVFDVSRRLREHGWLVPAYTFPADREDLAVLRVVCRNGFSEDLGGLLMDDLDRLLPELRRQPGPLNRPESVATAFHH